MERNTRDAKSSDAPQGATGSPLISYVPREGATPKGELSALAAVYEFVLERYNEGKKGVRTESGHDGGTEEAEGNDVEEILSEDSP